jgi:hypothetical protein
MNRNSSTRPATAAENTPVLTPLPPPRVPVIDYREQPFAPGPVRAFPASEMGKLNVAEDPLIDWHISGTNLEATFPYQERTYRVKCQTTLADECIDSWSVEVYSLEAVEFVRGGGPYVVIGGQHFKERHLSQSEHDRLFEMLHESAGEFLYYRSPTVIAAHEAGRGEQRAENIRDFQEGIGC